MRFVNCNILTPDGFIENSSFNIEGNHFQNVGEGKASKKEIDLDGAYVVPGIIDIHGDSFERCIAPRPGVHMPLKSAIHENDSYLLNSGITTFFYSITDSFESGLRSRENAREIVNLVNSTELRCGSYLHIRHEVANTKGHDELLEWIEQGTISMLSINDHLPRLEDTKNLERYKNGIKRRLVMSEEEIEKFILSLQTEREVGRGQIDELFKAAQKKQIPIASHDDDSPEKVALSIEHGVNIAEFPMNAECAKALNSAGISTLFGAPNLIRGGSHVGALSAYDAAREGLLDILCSDYHYPSLFLAPFKLRDLDVENIEEAWKRVSINPAKAALLADRKGSIEDGKDADFLILKSLEGRLEDIRSVYVEGACKVAYA